MFILFIVSNHLRIWGWRFWYRCLICWRPLLLVVHLVRLLVKGWWTYWLTQRDTDDEDNDNDNNDNGYNTANYDTDDGTGTQLYIARRIWTAWTGTISRWRIVAWCIAHCLINCSNEDLLSEQEMISLTSIEPRSYKEFLQQIFSLLKITVLCYDRWRRKNN